MHEIISFHHDIASLWDAVKQIRDEVESSLEKYDEEMIYASKMTASELIENAVKHGSSPDGETGIQFDFFASETQVKITVTNKISSQDNLNTLKSNIEQIQLSDNVEELYINRLCTLMENTKLAKSQLGLFRIAYEGGFDLNYKLENNIVTVTAVKNIDY